MAKPVLKWAGGKRQILQEIRDCFPPESDVNTYHEPFFGGGALFFETGPHSKGSSINDINKRLMSFYRVVRDKPEELIEVLESFNSPKEDTDLSREFANSGRDGESIDNYYYQQRELFNRRPNNESYDEVEEAALLMYLNRTCYNGLYRENNDGEFNVPVGRQANADWVQHSRIYKAEEALQGTKIKDGDFSYILEDAKEGDLVYFDPPYRPVSATSSFVEYSSESFGPDEQKRLRDLVRELHEQGVYVVVSNSPPIRELYRNINGIQINGVGAKRMINSKSEDRGEVEEIIITNVPPNKQRGQNPEIEEYAQGSSR